MIYRHIKTNSLYLRLPFIVLESSNDQPRERKILYLSLRKMQLNVRRESEFLDGRFKKLL